MQTKKRPPSLTDRRLRLLLKQLREEPAAPQDFRDRVLARLEGEGVLPRPAAVAAPGWGQRLRAWLRPAGVGLAAAGALAWLLVLRPIAPLPAPAPVVSVARPRLALKATSSPRRSQVLAAASRRRATAPVASAKPVAVEHELETAPQVASAVAPALGDVAAPGPVQQQQVSGVGVTATATQDPASTVSKDPGYALNSQVWNNVIHASRGEQADIRFSFKTTGPVSIEIFDRMGHSVAVLCDGVVNAGSCQQYTWRGTDDQGGMAASGIYMVRIHTPDYTETHKLMLVK